MAEKNSLIRCDCGHFHKEEETETVIVKLVKGKECELKVDQLLNTNRQEITTDFDFVSKDPPKTKEVTAPKQQELPKQVKMPDPNGFQNMMFPTDHPLFESRGDKTRRKA